MVNKMKLYQKIINQKINSLTVDDLLKYSKQYNIKITRDEASKALLLIKKNKNADIFDDNERKRLLLEVAKITNINVARELNELFLKFIKA